MGAAPAPAVSSYRRQIRLPAAAVAAGAHDYISALLVLDGGRIVESGSHAELLADDGLYASLSTRQMDIAEHDGPPPAAALPGGDGG